MNNCYATLGAKEKLQPYKIQRRELFSDDIEIEILYCGICHSDIHTAKNEWGGAVYPVVPGHEIVGKVIKIGKEVSKFSIGETVGVGVLVDSCLDCKSCHSGEEQYCDNNKMTFTYNSPDPRTPNLVTYGGYAKTIVTREHFVVKVSDRLNLAGVAPLLCAGITTYSPLKHWKVSRGMKVGIVGLGGLGHMGLKFSHAFGANTVLFTTSKNKVEDGLKLGADQVVISNDENQMNKHIGSFDFILNTVSANHNLDAYTSLLKRDGTLCLVGLPEFPHPSPSVGNLIVKRRSIAGSMIGGIKETQEMLDFCEKHNIVSEVEVISADKINEAYDRVLKQDVKYRFVIDNKTI